MIDKILIDRSVVEQALEALGMMSTPSPLVFLPDEIQSWQNANEALRAALKQPQVEQSSVVGVIGWKNHLPNSGTVVHWTALIPPLGTKLYIHPQPPRQPLTDEQIGEIEGWFSNEFGLEAKHSIDFARAIERAHGIGGEA
jgi:hypothetical protein